MSFLEDLISGTAEYLAGLTDSPFTWRESGVYEAGEFGIYALTAPLNRHHECVVIAPFFASDDPSLSDSEVSLQFDFYGTKVGVIRALDYAFDALQGFWSGTLGSVHVETIVRTYGTPMGIDESGTFRYTDNYDLAVHRPSTNRQ